MKIKTGEKGGSNASEDPLNFREWVGGGRGPASDQGGSYKGAPFQNPQFRKKSGGGSGPRSPSGYAHEMLFPMRSGQLESNQGKRLRITGTSP